MLLKTLLSDFKYELYGVSLETEITLVTTKLEDMGDGTLCILTKPKRDLPRLGEKSGIIIIDTPPEKIPSVPYIVCEDIRSATAFIYSRLYGISYDKLSFIGITGTNGKSSTLTILYNILKANGRKVGCIKTGEISIDGTPVTGSNYSMTTPDPSLLYKTIRDMEDWGCDTVIMEVSSHSLALGKVAPISFDYAIFTGISPEHLDFHSDMEEYYRTKRKLFYLARCAVINIDDSYGVRLYSELGIRKIGYGVSKKADAFIEDYEPCGFSGSHFKFRLSQRQINIHLPLIGSYNVYNALSAITVGCDMKISAHIISRAIDSISKIEGRFQPIGKNFRIIVDYAHTERAFECFLRELRLISGEKAITVIFGCGGERDRGKRAKMGEYAEKYADKIILTEDNSRSEEPMNIIRDILLGIKSKPVYIDTVRKRAIRNAIISNNDDEIIAVVGKGAEKYYIDKSGYHEYDEISYIRSILHELERKNENKA